MSSHPSYPSFSFFRRILLIIFLSNRILFVGIYIFIKIFKNIYWMLIYFGTNEFLIKGYIYF